MFLTHIKFDPFCLHWNCSLLTGHAADQLTGVKGATPMQEKWIKLDLVLTVEIPGRVSIFPITGILCKKFSATGIKPLQHRK